jgi:tetratricopeptide (TPR) repeat protein
MVLVYSRNANGSIQIKREVERATSKGIPIIPFSIEDVLASKFLEYHLSTAYWLDAVSPPFESHLQHLGEVIGKLTMTPWGDVPHTLPGSCVECGAAIQPGDEKCNACGHVIEVSTPIREALPGAGRRLSPRRRWAAFRRRSRAAKIGLIAACVATLALVLYFGTKKSNVEAYVNQAGAYLNNQEFDQAIEESTKAIKEDPSKSSGYRFRGYAYFQRAIWRNVYDDFPRAAADFNAAINLDQRDAFAGTMLGQTYLRMGEMPRAVEAFSAALAIDSRNMDSLKGRGHACFALKNYDCAIRDYTEASKVAIRDPEPIASRGYAYIEKGDYESALNDFESAININPSNPIPYRGKGEAYRRLGKMAEAIRSDQMAITLSSGHQQHEQGS